MPLYVTGLPGSGKSAVGEILKGDFGYDVIDFDDLISVELQKGFNRVLRDNGFVELQHVEGRLLKRFKKFDKKIVVCLGVVSNISLFEGKIVYIKISKDKFIQRIKKVSQKIKDMEKIYENVHKVFSQHADLVISSENKTKFEIARIIDDFYRREFNK
ncbi:shikimate kinase [Thermosipho ferrireducens]|uniref:Shikimate kinase n=1 Tax=Thermosipho ferrireducens TaxID=2571116 RepID=A0ABX7S711_9BACT|nr:shikimate kinase [Thermosipho ferrireducens]QTA38379.1 shikimate kinase [Thermosipho ferrireducens]